MQDSVLQLELLEAICAMDSRTHEGAEGTIRVADALGAPLRAMGFEVDKIAPLPEENLHGRHLKAVRNPSASTKLIFIGHTDIILSPKDVPFRVDRASGRVYGSGVCDMKGGCLVLQEAIRLALDESDAVRQAGLVVLLNSAEELPGTSFAQLARDTAKEAMACLAFEPAPQPSNGTHGVVAARKGIVRLDLTCLGRAAHAGNNHEHGISAIRELARKIEQIERLTDYTQAVSANVGFIKGGRVANQVPDEAYAEFEVRAFDNGKLEATWEAIKALCAESSVCSAADGQSTRLVLRGHRAYPPWPQNPGTERLVQRYQALADVRGLAIRAVSSGGGADASHVADLVPTLDGLGPVGGAMHSTAEWADLITWPLRVRIAADLIKDLCGSRLR